MDITNIVSVTVSLASAGVSKLGFGEPGVLFYGPDTVPTSNPITDLELVRRYSSSTALTDMQTDGFTATDPVYLAVQSIVSQSPHPSTVKVIRGGSAFTHAVELTPDTFTSGATISVTLSKGGTSRTYTQTAGGVSLDAEATALAAAMNADASGWGTSGSGELTIAGATSPVTIDAVSPANDGEMWYYSSLTNLSLDDVTTDRGMATDLGAAVAVDADWYELVLADAFGGAEITAASTWVAAQTNKALSCATQDADVMAGTGIGHDLSALNHTATHLIHSKHSMAEYPGGASAGRFLPLDPGTYARMHKSLTGVTPSRYTSSQLSAIHADYVNTYTGVTAGGVSIVTGNLFKGWASGSSESFIDTNRLIDATVFEVQSRVLAALRTADKIPYTDKGISTIKNEVLSGIRQFQPLGYETGSEFCNVPAKSSISSSDIEARDLPDITAGATLAGGIATVVITMQLSQ